MQRYREEFHRPTPCEFIRDWREGRINSRLKLSYIILVILVLISLLISPSDPKTKEELKPRPTSPVFLNENSVGHDGGLDTHQAE